MAWPSALTTNADITKFIFEQGVTRILETGGSFSDLHTGVALEVRNWLESNSVSDADDITNATAFAGAAANLFASKLLASRDEKLSDHYRLEYLRLMRNTRADMPLPDAATGGTRAEVVVIKQGRNYFTPKRSGQVFEPRRL